MSGAGAASQRSTPQKGALKGQPHLPLEDVKGLKAKTLANPCIEGFKWVSSASKHDSWGVMMEATRNHTSENQPRTPSGVGLIQPDFLPLSKGQKVRVPPPAPHTARARGGWGRGGSTARREQAQVQQGVREQSPCREEVPQAAFAHRGVDASRFPRLRAPATITAARPRGRKPEARSPDARDTNHGSPGPGARDPGPGAGSPEARKPGPQLFWCSKKNGNRDTLCPDTFEVPGNF